MNERMEATIVCCAKLANGDTPTERAASFVDNVKRATGFTPTGIQHNEVIMMIAHEIGEHGIPNDALRRVGL